MVGELAHLNLEGFGYLIHLHSLDGLELGFLALEFVHHLPSNPSSVQGGELVLLQFTLQSLVKLADVPVQPAVILLGLL